MCLAFTSTRWNEIFTWRKKLKEPIYPLEAPAEHHDSMNASDTSALRAHVAELEQQLTITKAILRRAESRGPSQTSGSQSNNASIFGTTVSLPIGQSLHNLLLLSDSALPLGSFAYSSGLESFLAHHKPVPQGETVLSLFHKFLKLSIQSVAYTNVPYMLAVFRDPLAIMDLDNDLDASTLCTVQRRASIAQGKALLSIWEKAFRDPLKAASAEDAEEAVTALELFASELKVAAITDEPLPANGHVAPLWGIVTLTLGLNLEEAGYMFLLGHAKAVISAAVRASVMGPYMAQNILASHDLQNLLRKSLERVWFLQPEDAGQVVPILDLWIGRHEKLYSRIFNS